MKIVKDKRTCIRLENNEYKTISKLARQENKSVSQIFFKKLLQN